MRIERLRSGPPGLYAGRADIADFLENVLETELDDARVDACGSDLSERVGIIPQPSGGICELGSIKGIVKLRPELEGMTLSNRRVLDNRDIPVKLAGTTSNTNAGIAPSGAVAIDPTGWQCAECAGVEIAGAAACSTQPVMNVAGGSESVSQYPHLPLNIFAKARSSAAPSPRHALPCMQARISGRSAARRSRSSVLLGA